MMNDVTPRPRDEHDKNTKNTDAHHESPFKTPEQTAATDATKEPQSSASMTDHGKQSKKHWWKRLSKKQWIIIAIVAAVIVLGGGGALAWKLTHHTKPAPAKIVKKTTPKPAPPQPTTVASTLTGLQVDPSVNQRPVTAVMIENSTDARPQSGLDQAGVVFEAVAEGGITRFLALFQDTQPGYIGPVRSVRPYYIQWLMGFDASVAHVGGSPEGISDLKTWGVKDLDQFYNGSYYQRISSRYAPHNVYTSMANLNALEAKKGIGASTYTGFARKPEAPSKTPNATSIDLAISGFYYNVHYDYDPATNSYKRSEAGKPHMEVDANGAQTQIQPKVVVALVMPQGIEADDLHTSYATIGSGQAFVFQDGIVTPGTWHKDANNKQFTFTDSNGKVLAFNPGQTWLTAMGSAGGVTYK
ncbi:MAG TPA: DUF3048 domain-containing protein [Candidatus Saccharimonadales bacterium]|jgi:hypothetical protein|nr:DUF3048 domain-containing protein [Candidatus Saccharimonadales bacterium]